MKAIYVLLVMIMISLIMYISSSIYNSFKNVNGQTKKEYIQIKEKHLNSYRNKTIDSINYNKYYLGYSLTIFFSDSSKLNLVSYKYQIKIKE